MASNFSAIANKNTTSRIEGCISKVELLMEAY